MSEISQALAMKAMDALAMRQTAIAQNIANAGSETLQRKSVSFEDALREAAEEGPEAVRALVFNIENEGPEIAGGEIRLDLEMQSSSSTAGRYAALADLMGRQMQIARAAVRGQ